MKRLLFAVVLLTSITLLSLFAEDGAHKPSQPKVLIIGDSISMGYTPYVQTMLEDRAIVTRNRGNARYTGEGIKMLDTWLGDTTWDIIHFNWGLWDMYGWQFKDIDRSPATYEKRLEELVIRLKRTGAKLIWGTTTPVCTAPEKAMANRYKLNISITPAVEKEYLDAALRVMTTHHIQVNDLHALIAPELKQYALAADDVHYTKAGYEKLGKQVAESIEKNLKGEKNAPDKD